jgi:hypothetical protein
MSALVKSIEFKMEDAVAFMKKATLADVERLEKNMIDAEINMADELNDSSMFHKLCNGMYVRALFVPKGAFLTGKIHKNRYIDICAYGDIDVKNFYCDDKECEVERITTFKFLEGNVGRKRVGLAREDTLWITVDRTEVTNVDDAEDDTLVFNSSAFMKIEEKV